MAIQRILPHGQAYTTLHGVLREGSDPSRGAAGTPAKHLSTVTTQLFDVEGRRDASGLLGGGPPWTALTCSLTVADNDFTNRAEIILGNYVLISNIDYAIGGGVAATATNIAAAISLLPEFSASALGAVVSISYGPTLSQVDFRVRHSAAIYNFTTLVPDTGIMTLGAPIILPPTIT